MRTQKTEKVDLSKFTKSELIRAIEYVMCFDTRSVYNKAMSFRADDLLKQMHELTEEANKKSNEFTEYSAVSMRNTGKTTMSISRKFLWQRYSVYRHCRKRCEWQTKPSIKCIKHLIILNIYNTKRRTRP